MITRFNQLFEQVRKARTRKLVVPAAEGSSIVKACYEAFHEGICNSVLIGSRSKIEFIMEEAGIEPDVFEIIDLLNNEAKNTSL